MKKSAFAGTGVAVLLLGAIVIPASSDSGLYEDGFGIKSEMYSNGKLFDSFHGSPELEPTDGSSDENLGSIEIEPNTLIQNITSEQCAALPIYDGSNDSAIRTVLDTRGNDETYRIAKLADNNCWMLDNLRLGDEEYEITLTPEDSNVDEEFELPPINGGTPQNGIAIFAPDGYTGNDGYFYSFHAAVAGKEDGSADTGNTKSSICPVNWRLPSGGYEDSDVRQLDIAFGGTGEYHDFEPTINYWLSAFKALNLGTVEKRPSGPRIEGAGEYSGFWTATIDINPHEDHRIFVYNASEFEVNPGVDPTTTFGGPSGMNIRCMLGSSHPYTDPSGGPQSE